MWPVELFRRLSSNMSRLPMSKVMIILRKQLSINVKQDKPEGKAEVQKELEEGLEVLIQNNIDLIIVEVVATNLSLYFSFHHSKTTDHKKKYD